MLLLSCESETIEVGDGVEGKEYFPVETGRTWTYTYDSTIYDLSRGQVFDVSGFILEEIGEQLSDGRYELRRSWKRNPTDPWIFTDLWTTRVEETRAIRTEENLSFIKLVFPPRSGVRWNGNSLFKDDTEIVVAGEALRPYIGWRYEIQDTTSSFINGDLQFNETVSVIQTDEDINLERRFSYEKFAKGIGLVEKRLVILDCQCSPELNNTPWEEKAEKGFILNQRLISFQ